MIEASRAFWMGTRIFCFNRFTPRFPRKNNSVKRQIFTTKCDGIQIENFDQLSVTRIFKKKMLGMAEDSRPTVFGSVLLCFLVAQFFFTVVASEFNFTIGPNSEVAMTFKETVQLNITVTYSDLIGNVALESMDTSVVVLTDPVELTILANTSFPFHVPVRIHGQYVGRSGIKVVHSSGDVPSLAVNVGPPFQELSDVATIILVVWLVISYVVMAAKVEPRVLIEKIKPPWGIITGMLCQFVLMPPVAFTLARVFDMRGAMAVGLVLVGTCPGGFFSNIIVLLLDCDLVLSLAMTTFSTLLAVGMMPINLLIYAQPFIESDERLATPFKELLIQLCGLVVPLVFGVPFFYKFPKVRQFCLKLVKPFTFILMILGVVLYIPSQYYVFFGDWKVWVTSTIVTLIGAFLGMAVSRIANFSYFTSTSIAIETGCQNTLLAVSVAKLFYVAPESDVVAIVPLLIAIVSAAEGFVAILLYYMYLFATKKNKVTSSDEEQPPRNDKKLAENPSNTDEDTFGTAAVKDGQNTDSQNTDSPSTSPDKDFKPKRLTAKRTRRKRNNSARDELRIPRGTSRKKKKNGIRTAGYLTDQAAIF